ncbi:MAG TPA: M42 family metallopeptidase, partial [Clostridiales bacterium]|nr:M42 family metallopeptidase [Clostridiales bacterium]
RLVFDAHMDEVGFMIRSIGDDGFLSFTTLGGIDTRVLSARRVILGSYDGSRRIFGYITSKPIHLQGGSDAPGIDSLYIDIGAKNKAEAEKYVLPGDYGVFDSEFIRLGEHKVKGKAFDDRFGCAIMIETIRALKADRPDFDTYFAFSVREELGLHGAAAAAWHVRPDFAVALEATACADLYGAPQGSRIGEQGEGGLISAVDAGAVYDERFVKFAFELAEEYGIKAQPKRLASGSNDSAAYQRSRSGAAVLALSAPSRYIHSASSVIDMRDYESILALAVQIARNVGRLAGGKTPAETAMN